MASDRAGGSTRSVSHAGARDEKYVVFGKVLKPWKLLEEADPGSVLHVYASDAHKVSIAILAGDCIVMHDDATGNLYQIDSEQVQRFWQEVQFQRDQPEQYLRQYLQQQREQPLQLESYFDDPTHPSTYSVQKRG